MRTLLFSLIVFISQSVSAQIPAEKVDGMYVNWCSAKIQLVSDEEIACEIRFDQLNQKMDVRYNGHKLEIPGKDILAFNFYDSVKQQERFFEKITIPSGKVIMMEFIFKSSTAAIFQERFISNFHMWYPSPITFERQDFYHTKPADKKFLANRQTKKVLPMSKNNLFVLFKDKKREITVFATERKLSFESENDFIEVLKFYDNL